MPPKGRGRKRPISESNFIDELRVEVEQSITVETTASDAFRILSSTPMNADSIKRLPFKVVERYLSAKFDKDLLAFVTSSIAELRVLPESVRVETVAKLSGLSIDLDEVSHVTTVDSPMDPWMFFVVCLCSLTLYGSCVLGCLAIRRMFTGWRNDKPS